jgi:hypothetical protein
VTRRRELVPTLHQPEIDADTAIHPTNPSHAHTQPDHHTQKQVSQSIAPVDIRHVAAEAGILPDELEPYGKHKAKVRCDFSSRRVGGWVVLLWLGGGGICGCWVWVWEGGLCGWVYLCTPFLCVNAWRSVCLSEPATSVHRSRA